MRAAFLLLLAACISTPETRVQTSDSRPSLAIQGAPSGSQLFVDGNAVGAANAYNGQPAVLRVEPGTHEIDVRDVAGRVLYRQRIFVESETKIIQVN